MLRVLRCEDHAEPSSRRVNEDRTLTNLHIPEHSRELQTYSGSLWRDVYIPHVPAASQGIYNLR